ncbi:hypothetical protein D3C74_94120 [compost metagenome]
MHKPKDERLRELCEFFGKMERRMLENGRVLVALHARGQYRKYHRQLVGRWTV